MSRRITGPGELLRAAVLSESVMVRRLDGVWHTAVPWDGHVGRVRAYGSWREAMRVLRRLR